MRAICRFNRSSDLADHQRGRFASVDSEYPLSVGGEYVVLGMGIWENVLSYLVRDDIGHPAFAPTGLFERGEDAIPSHWLFALREGISASGRERWVHPCSAIWGYPALVGFLLLTRVAREASVS